MYINIYVYIYICLYISSSYGPDAAWYLWFDLVKSLAATFCTTVCVRFAQTGKKWVAVMKLYLNKWMYVNILKRSITESKPSTTCTLSSANNPTMQCVTFCSRNNELPATLQSKMCFSLQDELTMRCAAAESRRPRSAAWRCRPPWLCTELHQRTGSEGGALRDTQDGDTQSHRPVSSPASLQFRQYRCRQLTAGSRRKRRRGHLLPSEQTQQSGNIWRNVLKNNICILLRAISVTAED